VNAVYRRLDAEKIIATIERLERRIRERFPDASLAHATDELLRIARESAGRIEELARPNIPLRAAIGVLLAGLVVVLFMLVPTLRLNWQIQGGTELIQTLDALLEALFFIGGSIAFLVTIESRLKRSKALAVIHELRSLAHIVDMHQLTKDPEHLLAAGPRTASSPERKMTDFELQRYLDYSSELLALTGKVAALYMEGLADPVVLSAVDEIETLTDGFSRKIWQKITILEQVAERRRAQASKLAPPRPLIGAGTTGDKLRRR
jgi:hypothetical protein